ncbi:integrase arm-type DNA-binding domain-containing protein [Nostoc sp. NIES-2111]
MAQTYQKLTARTVETLDRPGRHSDGGGLYLSIGASGGRRWVFLYRDRSTGKLREMGLGAAPGRGKPGVPLVEARGRAADARELLEQGIDPIEAKRLDEVEQTQERAAADPEAIRKAAEAARARTFGAVADKYISTHDASWRNAKHADQWRMTMKVYAAPLRDKDVAEITMEDVLGVLKPLWQTKPETASRVRGRIETILDAAKAAKLRSGENVAAWKGNLAHWLPKRSTLTRGHHAALPYSDVPSFIVKLREHETMSALALDFCILTAPRTSEEIGARWAEIDLDAGVWTIPPARMKSGRQHRVLLSSRARAVLDVARLLSNGEHVFPAQRQAGKGLSTMALEMCLRRLGADVTVHGFRSSFRDWGGDATSFPRDLLEVCLAHKVGDDVEEAYRRSDALERRRGIMEAWAAHCGSGEAPSNVVKLSRA